MGIKHLESLTFCDEHPLLWSKKMKNFKELRIWQKGMEIAANCFRITKDFPSQEKYALAVQITKCGISIPSNIAEGSSCSSPKQYAHFAEIALGSAFELETQLLIAQRVSYGDQSLISTTLTQLNDEQKMLLGFIKKLHQTPKEFNVSDAAGSE